MAAAWRSKWLDWQPGDEIISTFPGTSPTKPTKWGFDGSVGSKVEEPQIISAPAEPSPRPETMAAVELLPAEVRQWDDTMLLWTQARCAFCERSWGSVSRLCVDHIEWAHHTGQPFAPDRKTFIAILMALGFQIQDAMVYGLVLREDLEAALRTSESTLKMTR